MDVFHRKGLKIPGNISVVGFDNVRWARFLNPKLSTVDYPINEMSRAAVHRILGQVYDKETRKFRSMFEPRFIQRSSSGPVRGGR